MGGRASPSGSPSACSAGGVAGRSPVIARRAHGGYAGAAGARLEEPWWVMAFVIDPVKIPRDRPPPPSTLGTPLLHPRNSLQPGVPPHDDSNPLPCVPGDGRPGRRRAGG